MEIFSFGLQYLNNSVSDFSFQCAKWTVLTSHFQQCP
jgi:hypothetical protein